MSYAGGAAKVWREFREKTSSHGIPQVDRSRHKGMAKTGFWSVVSLGCMGFLIYHITMVTMAYCRRQVDVSIQIEHHRELTFPAITVCNSNPIKMSEALTRPELRELLFTKNNLGKRRRKRGTCSETTYMHNGGETCYWVPDENLYSFQQARLLCNTFGGSLAIIDTLEKHQHLLTNYIVRPLPGDSDTYSQYVWIDLRRALQQDAFLWADQDPVSWTVWDTISPLPYDNQCASINREDSDWTTLVQCNQVSNTVLCQKVLVAEATPTAEPETTPMETTTIVPTTTAVETTTILPTTTEVETSTILPTTTVPETTTSIPTTTVLGTTTLMETTVETTVETTTPIETTVETTTPIETTMTTTFDATTTATATALGSNTPTVTTVATTSQQASTEASEITTVQATTTTTALPQSTTSTNQATSASVSDTTPTRLTTLLESTEVLNASSALHSILGSLSTTMTSIPKSTLEVTTPAMSSSQTTHDETPQTEATAPVTHMMFEEQEDFTKQEMVMSVLSGVPDEVREMIGHQKSDFIFGCSFAGKSCDLNGFSQFYDPNNGNCYIYNSGWDKNASLVISKRAGRRFGLNLILNIQQHEYLEDLGESAGARLLILPQGEMPFPQDEGIMAKPGELTSIGMREAIINRMKYPYGDCTDKTTVNITNNVFEEFYPVEYTSTACLKTCYQRHLTEACACADPQIPAAGYAYRNKAYPACRIHDANRTESQCKQLVDQKYINNELECFCPNACFEKKYSLEVSTNVWPSRSHEKKVIRKLKEERSPFYALYNDSATLRDNLMKIEVYYEDLNSEQISEKPTYDITNLMSDLGGILGLWVGCSIVSLFEFFELFLDLIALGLYKRCSVRKKPTLVQPLTPGYPKLEDYDRNSMVHNIIRGSENQPKSPLAANIPIW